MSFFIMVAQLMIQEIARALEETPPHLMVRLLQNKKVILMLGLSRKYLAMMAWSQG
jgi:hypothetical protein